MGAKIATCCYCGARAALVFDKGLHELSCAACGAPLHEMKAMPLPARAQHDVKRGGATPNKPRPGKKRPKRYDDDRRKHRPYKRRKSISRWVLEEFWDAVEDIFD